MAIKRPRSPKPGRGTGRDGSMAAVASRSGDDGGEDDPIREIIDRRLFHPEHAEHQNSWRRLLDSLEGGDRYRNATYGMDRRGLPVRNLQRHPREYPDPQRFPSSNQGYPASAMLNDGAMAVIGGSFTGGFGPFPGAIGADPLATANDDDYELRRARTPVPGWVSEACSIHLGKLYDQEVHREGPADLTAWWEDVDGKGTPIDDFMRETIAPLVLVLGCLDIVLDHPAAPSGEKVATKSDEMRLGLDKVVASYVLPENMVWWRLDDADRYVECLVREYVDPSDRVDVDEHGNQIDPQDEDKKSHGYKAAEQWRKNYVRYRHWTEGGWTLRDYEGDVIDEGEHPYGRVPIVRLIDQRKHRTRHIGTSRYEEVASLMRAFYNLDSELIFSNTVQALPFLSGPEDWCKADQTVNVGPAYILPMKRDTSTGSYQGWEFVSPPKDPAESIRKCKEDLVDAKDRAACLAKPAGAVAGATTAQSGVSKQLDAVTGHKLLASIAKTLAKAERFLAEYALMVLRNKAPDRGEDLGITITYPAKFELFGAAELIDNLTKLQVTLQAAGEAPETEREILQQIVRQTLVGLTDEEYEALDAEIELMVETKARLKEQIHEMRSGILDKADTFVGSGASERTDDPSGQSGQTSVGALIPAVM